MLFNNKGKNIFILNRAFMLFLAVLFISACQSPEEPLTTHTPSPDNKTYVKFDNKSDFDVYVYVNMPPSSVILPTFDKVIPKGGNMQFEISPSAANSNGDTFYFEYQIPIGSITIPYYSATNVIIQKIYEDDINTLTIPVLSSASTTSSFMVIENISNTDIWVQDGSTPLKPHGQQNREIPKGKNGVFVLPQNITSISNYTVGAVTRKNIPNTPVQAGRIYAFKYDGSAIYMYSESHFNLDDRRKIWSIPTSNTPGKYMRMGKQKPRRNPADGFVVLGRLEYDVGVEENSRAYFALVDEYGSVTKERIFSLPNDPVIRFLEVHERENGDFIIAYLADYEEESKFYLMCYTSNGITKWQVDCGDNLPESFDPDDYYLEFSYIAEKDSKTFALGGQLWDYRDDGDYVAAIVTEVKENALGNEASLSWSEPYISDFICYDADDDYNLSARWCRGLVYSQTQDAYIAIEFFVDNKIEEGIYKILKASDGTVIRQNSSKEFNRYGFTGINQVDNKYYVFGGFLDANLKYSAAALRFNLDMTVDTSFTPLYVPSDTGSTEFLDSIYDASKVIFVGSISDASNKEMPWTYAVNRDTGAKLWENVYNDSDYDTIWSVGKNSIGTMLLELYNYETGSSLLASTDLFGQVSTEMKAPIPRSSSLTVTSPRFTVTYNINSGTGTTPATQTVNAGSSVTIASGSGLSRSGYTFAGWNTNSSGTGTNYDAGSYYTPTGSITLYANWTSSVLSPPSNIIAIPVNGGIRITWTSVSNAQGYTVYRASGMNGTYSAVTTNTDATTYLDSTSGTTTYYYKVATVNTSGVTGSQSAYVFSAGPGSLTTLPYYTDKNTYFRGTISANAINYYRFQAPANKYTWIEWADYYDGGSYFSPALTGDIVVSAYYEDTGTAIFENIDDGDEYWDPKCMFNPGSTARYVIVKVVPYFNSGSSDGSYCIRYDYN